MWRISYIYNAARTKPAKVGIDGAYTYYAGSFVYSGSSLTYITHREGMDIAAYNGGLDNKYRYNGKLERSGNPDFRERYRTI